MRNPTRDNHRWSTLLILVALAGTLICPVGAQHHDRFEFQVGGGYGWGGGGENPAPSLPAYDVGLAVWLSDHWGIAGRRTWAPGQDLYDPPRPGGDRIFAGKEKLQYWTVTARRRWFLARSTDLNIGFGLMLGGSFEYVEYLTVPGEPPRRIHPEAEFGGFSLELLVGHKLSRYIGVKGGFTGDFNFETANTQLVGMLVFSF